MFDFPSPPTVGQTVTAPNGAAFIWDGAKWTASSGVAQPIGGPFLPLSGSAGMVGPLSLAGNATQPLHAVPLQQLTSTTAGFLPLSGGTVSGPTTFTDMVSMTGSCTWASGAYPGTNPAIYQNLTYTGTATAAFPGPEGQSVPVNLFVLSENMTVSAPAQSLNGFEIQHNTTGGAGGRHGLLVTQQIVGAMGAFAPNYVGAQIFQVFGGNVAGAASGAGNGKGDAFGLGIQMQVGAGIFAHGVTGIELDIAPASGASVDYLVGEQIVNFGVAGQLANVFDCMHLLCTSNPATQKRSNFGYYFGNPQAADGHGFPITATGTMIGSQTGSTGIGIDFSAVTFATAFLRGPNGFQVANNNWVSTDVVRAPSNVLFVVDAGNNPICGIYGGAGAVNYPNIQNAPAGSGPSISSVGADTNIDLTLFGKGTGGVRIAGRAGFNNTAPIAKPTVTGAKGSNAALASLLTALASYGLVTDSTTA